MTTVRVQLLEELQSLHADSRPLRLVEIPDVVPQDEEVLLDVRACGVCHTELDEIEGRTPPARLPMVLGHQVVGTVIACGPGVAEFNSGDRVGVAWIFSACGACVYCQTMRENLCASFQATGRDRFGGYADMMVARASFLHRLPAGLSDIECAPLLCAGAIGYRSLRLSKLTNGQSLGLTGFGASAHLVLKMVRHRMPDSPVYVFARNDGERKLAMELGATWAGDTLASAPELLDTIIDTTPAWLPIVGALDNLVPGGRLVINAIRKEKSDQSELLRLDYSRHLWMEKNIISVANVTRQDVREFLSLAAEASLTPQTQVFPLAEANRALVELKTQGFAGAKVLVV